MIRTPNDKIYDRKHKTISLICCNGEKVLIDWEDEPIINGKRVWVDGGYAKLKINGKTFRLHNIILSPREGLVVDHINRNPLDNRKSNLRLCTPCDNAQNRKLHKNNTSGYSNITFNYRQGRYSVSVIRFGIKYYLGSFSSIREAKRSLNNKSI